MITDNIIISLNSKYGERNNGTFLSSMNFNFKGILKENQLIKKKYISLLNAQIPVSFYIINEYNNKLALKDLGSGGGGATYNILIDYGNYSANSLITELTSKIIASGIPHTVSITLNKATGKLTFIFSGNTQFRMDQSNIHHILGFDSNVSGTTVIMPYPINILGCKKLFIKSQNLAISSYESYTNTKSNILATIPVDTPFYNLISYSSSIDANQHELKINIIDAIDINIYDEDNNFINFNNIDWSITLCLTVEREEKLSISMDMNAKILETQQQLTLPAQEIQTKSAQNLTQEMQQQDEQPEQTQSDSLSQRDEPQQQLTEIKMSHEINQPKTFSETMKQYSEAMIKGSNNYTTSDIDFIKKYGDNMITGMKLMRTPVQEMIIKALNASSLGKFEKENPYDKLFHLAVILTLDNNIHLKLEKNATINITDVMNAKEDTEYFNVNYPTENIVSFNTLLEKTRKRMGRKYFLYSSKSNNCQDFLLNVFDANEIGGTEEREFIKQDTRKIFNSNPNYLKRLSNYITDLGAKVDNTKSMIYNLYKHKKDLNFLLK